jgi:hypothetical protein
MSDNEDIILNGSTIRIVGVVRGLKSEAEKISKAFSEFKPNLLAMSISIEEIAGLRDYIKEPYPVEMSRYEELYAKHLSKFGDVFLPPPCFLAGIEEADKMGIEIVAVDMDDETHTAAFCAVVTGSVLFRHTTRFNLLKLRGFGSKTPEQFAKDWDKRVNNLRGFKELEKEREQFMANELKKIASTKKMILAVIDAERTDGIRARMS